MYLLQINRFIGCYGNITYVTPQKDKIDVQISQISLFVPISLLYKKIISSLGFKFNLEIVIVFNILV